MNKKIKFFILFLFCFFGSYARDPFLLPDGPALEQRIYLLHYAEVEQVGLKIKAFLSDAGFFIADKKTNRLWVYDDFKHNKKIDYFIKTFDQEPKQVFIKAMIALIDKESVTQLGSYLEHAGGDDGSADSSGTSSNSSSNASSYAYVPLVRAGSQNFLSVELTALEKKGRVVIISEPELITLDRKIAMIASGDEIPYQEKTGEGNTNITFKKAVLQLQVTPTILPNQKIHLLLNIHQDKPSDLVVDGVPGITTEQLTTEVLVKNHQTIILGGIHEQSNQERDNQIPWLSRIPIVGWLFKNKQSESKQQQLLVFITPSILSS